MLRHGGRTARVGVALALVLSAVACTSESGPDEVTATLPAGPVLADEPLALRIDGVEPGGRVTVAVRGGRQGRTVEADFTAADDGTVDLERDAPADGSSYSEASGFGLLWQLPLGDGMGRVAVTVSVAGDVVEELEQVRLLRTSDVRQRRLWPVLDGLSGRYFFPSDTTVERPAVVLFGGSEGGRTMDGEAQLLASHGYPALSLAYFDAPGIPRRLADIPIEYFERALEWTGRRRGVDPDRVVPYGVSRGSEAALLVASLSPKYADGAIAFAPNGIAVGSTADITDPAWLWEGEPVPWAMTRREWWYEPGEAVIDVWDVDGPILLVCGAADRLWPACSQSEDVAKQLAYRGEPAPTLLSFEGVGHEIGLAVPGAGGAGRAAGQDLQATGLARAEAWQAVLDHLAAL